MSKWTGIAAISLLMELMLLGLPIYLVWSLNMAISSKLVVVLVFWSRLP